jgi:hypothetical protein
VAIIVVDMLEIVDVEEGEGELSLILTLLEQAVDPVFDHAARRQVGQLVIIGRAE